MAVDPREYKRVLGDVAHWAYQGLKVYSLHVAEILDDVRNMMDFISAHEGEFNDSEAEIEKLKTVALQLRASESLDYWAELPGVVRGIVNNVYEAATELQVKLPVPKARRKKQ